MQTGMGGTATSTVGNEHTALALGSGDLDVLGTPALLALCEAATLDAISGAQEPGQTTVGVAFEIEHLAPAPVGAPVTARARLTGVVGRRLEFAVEAHSRGIALGRGTITRTIVDRALFIERMQGS